MKRTAVPLDCQSTAEHSALTSSHPVPTGAKETVGTIRKDAARERHFDRTEF